METSAKLLGSLLVFFYHCFDRLVIHGYLLGLSRPGNVVLYFQDVLGLSPITPEVLARPTREYQAWVEVYASFAFCDDLLSQRLLLQGLGQDFCLATISNSGSSSTFPSIVTSNTTTTTHAANTNLLTRLASITNLFDPKNCTGSADLTN
jgi:hypothetical protein